ncbi:hypothetical protein JR316_0012816 [Psilocybe cubensis]|uniref:Uncharacterized protein n=2 Tax=Psilocybe cubensis TaxID=181762 RepID=A0ACB8GFP3_PSICU|nr:hypothetical protein JR316_0012816 [Psilocybe cubensis]KAH9474358.1 hypothetical protein JR316_0012816 [Psilocybe cubensis]
MRAVADASDAIVHHDVDRISLLPPELLGEIFTYTSSFDPDAPLRVGEVSTLFRRTVRTTPQAWTRLLLSLSVSPSDLLQDANSVEDADGRAIRKAELWFAMSKVTLVDVSIELSSSAQGPSKNGSRNHTHILIPMRGQNLQDVQIDFSELILPHVLRSFTQRIRALDLLTTTENEAQAFLSAMYPSPANLLSHVEGDQVYPLQSLAFHASSDGSGHVPNRRRTDQVRAITRRGTCSNINTTTGALVLPSIPCLRHLSFYNHLLPPLSPENVKNLRVLQLHYPLRFSPISITTLLGVLNEARSLERVEIEARVTLENVSPSNSTSPSSNSASGSHNIAVSPPTTHPSNLATVALVPLLSPSDSNHAPSASSSLSLDSHSTSNDQLPLISLPRLTYLHLRINNLPSVLSQLLLPSLHTLSIDDLDGKRSGAAKQMAEVLRGLLVRMEMPVDDVENVDTPVEKKKQLDVQKGLEVLDMCSVALPASQGHHGGLISATDAQAAHAVWAWCFRRMRVLKEMRVKKMDADSLFELITPRLRTSRSGVDVGAAATTNSHGLENGQNEKDDIPLPALQKLVVVEQDAYHPKSSAALHRMNAWGHGDNHEFSSAVSSSPFDAPHSPASSNLNYMDGSSSASQDRNMDLQAQGSALIRFQMRRPEVEVIYDASSRQVVSSSVGVDFLDLYAG